MATLVSERTSPGHSTVTFDGAGLPSGFTVCRMNAGDFTASRKMLRGK